MTSNTGNLQKYLTKNPLKQARLTVFKQNIKAIVSQLKLKEEAVILDIGCGEGFVTCLLEEALPKNKIFGVDISAQAIKFAKTMTKGAEFIQGNIYDNDLEDNKYDLVVCTEVLEHLENPDAAVAELMRISGRYILITVPEEPYFCMGNFLSMKNIVRLGNPKDHLNLWTKAAFGKFLKQKLDDSDFKITEKKRLFPWQLWILEKVNH
jgi:2-polyprenyl-3-methyl-5-hydroxy-6-metoxy-1,4-benzoquinol methylase